MYHTEEEAREAIVTQMEARREIERHSLFFSDFLAEVGDKPSYSGAEVLNWLGY